MNNPANDQMQSRAGLHYRLPIYCSRHSLLNQHIRQLLLQSTVDTLSFRGNYSLNMLDESFLEPER
jgi:hypothetical protein